MFLGISIYHLEDSFGFWSNTDGPIQAQVSEMFLAVYAYIASARSAARGFGTCPRTTLNPPLAQRDGAGQFFIKGCGAGWSNLNAGFN